ncbi:MAG: AMP-binding protein [Muribaculaceae bacterium]|nr:AMP-binding protein [Muribaculaceae bacterium]
MTFEDFIKEWNSGSEFIEAHTSGSTGEPKIILLEKKFVKESAQRTIRFFGINSGSHLHSCVAADFIGGKMMAVRAFISGSGFSYEIPSNSPLKGLDPEQNLDLVAVVPSQVLYILDNLKKLPEIRNLLIGGSPVHQDLRKKIVESGLSAYESYGMTETASHIALRKIDKIENPFRLLPGISISSDEENCLIIHFPHYKEIVTNDIVEIISENEFKILGRRDQMILSGGKKINPYDVEKRVDRIIPHPFVFIGIPDEKWSEKVVLLIEANNDIIEKNILMKKLSSILSKWEMPKEIIFLDKLPRTLNGKIKRKLDIAELTRKE